MPRVSYKRIRARAGGPGDVPAWIRNLYARAVETGNRWMYSFYAAGVRKELKKKYPGQEFEQLPSGEWARKGSRPAVTSQAARPGPAPKPTPAPRPPSDYSYTYTPPRPSSAEIRPSQAPQPQPQPQGQSTQPARRRRGRNRKVDISIYQGHVPAWAKKGPDWERVHSQYVKARRRARGKG